MTGVEVLVGAVALTAGLAAWSRFSSGRLRRTRAVRSDDREDLRPLIPASGSRATLLQFSSAFCAPCRATKRVLSDIAAGLPGVEHVEVDAESQLELVRRLGILKTPTTLVLDASGREVVRASGQPRKEQVLAALESAV
ncbi:MAG: thioredoxin [Frankiales bacterium]|nr:thioredoxin [Frankiales bacterium]